MKRNVWLCLLLAAFSTSACTTERIEPDATSIHETLPPGEGLPPTLDAMLYGASQGCIKDSDCPGDVCYFGACIGLLVVDQRWMQEAITARLLERAPEGSALRERVQTHLKRVLDRSGSDLAFRARALVPLGAMGALPPLKKALSDPDERLQAAAAIALTRLGDTDGLRLTSALTEDPQPSVAAEALRALGRSQHPDALMPILRTLNADLDPALLRSALKALADHADLRSMKALRDWWPRAPEYLHHNILDTMRRISGANIGNDEKAWEAWFREHAPPDPPPFTPRVFRADADLGLPTP